MLSRRPRETEHQLGCGAAEEKGLIARQTGMACVIVLPNESMMHENQRPQNQCFVTYADYQQLFKIIHSNNKFIKFIFPSALRHCCLGDTKGTPACKKALLIRQTQCRWSVWHHLFISHSCHNTQRLGSWPRPFRVTWRHCNSAT